MRECPSELELSRAIDGALDLQLESHVLTCAACRTARDGFTRAIALARQIPLELPTPERRDEIRAAILLASARPGGVRSWLAASAGSRRRSRAWLVAPVAAAAAAVVAYLAWPAPAPEPAAHAHGTVRGGPGARYAALSPAPDERIRLVDGSLEVEVAPLHLGERFVIVVGDAEVEVRGTAFQVIAAGDRLVSVSVHHGRVEVRPAARTPALLTADQSWHAPVAHAEPPPAPAPAPAPTPPAKPRRRATPAIAVPDPPRQATAPAKSVGEVAYDDGWSAMRSGEFARAATAFSRVLILAPDGSLAEDAAFWYAVALGRAARPGEAMSAFRSFLELHRGSRHAGEASAMLGWLLVDARELVEAEHRFRAAADDPDPAVRKSARAGLDAVK